ncbi:MAG TPA: hypothetical protein VKK31_27685 [Thermoanaerobaculia bacterium]|nr:hypothetical protein [Thermoanaerobaculia bacterium]
MDENVTPKKVIVAVHGVGDQTQYATVKQVLSQFARYHGQAAAVPLGNFHPSGSSVVFRSKDLSGLGFVEVYWAGVPRDAVDKKYVLEDVKPWVKTIMGRVHGQHLANSKLTDADALMVEQVLGEMLQTIDVLGRLCYLADKMGIFSFDLRKVLLDFVDDVQVVAEFKDRGGQIGEIFAEQMQKVHDEFLAAGEEIEIYLVAHSEGTVVALLGLLTALCSQDTPWISKVRGFMTFGSPIDKHLILWSELFEDFQKPCQTLEQPIEWHNYFDYGDPVGFELDTARQRFTTGDWAGVFNFPDGPDGNDHGFSRYPMPGKAHTDYWQDEGVFGHFIRKVVYDGKVEPKPKSDSYKEPPGNKPLFQAIGWIVPYLGAAALMFVAVLVLYKAVHSYIDPRPRREDILTVFGWVGSFSCLLAGVTVLARIPRLTRMWTWRLFGLGVFLLSAVGFRIFPCVNPIVRNAAGGLQGCFGTRLAIQSQNLVLVAAAVVLVGAIYVMSKLFPKWGMRTLLIPGSLAVAIYAYLAVHGPGVPPHQGDLWPVFLAGAMFLYLWWLVALLFDLVFVWHRYIRMSVPIFKGSSWKSSALGSP